MAEVTNLPGVDRERREEWGPDTSNSMSEDMPQRHPSARSISSAMDPEPAHIDPYLAVRKMLWMLPDINDLVESAVERIQRVCAYNSVYFLKVVLDLQWTYLSLQPSPPEEVMLEKKHVMKIADFMATRMARRETEPGSLSRELQLRTLTSALMLLHRYEIRNLDDDTYAKLLHSVSERDSENEVRFLDGDNRGEYMAEGDIEYLALYACDLIRCLPPNKPDSEVLAEFGQPAVYFMIAAGMINMDPETGRLPEIPMLEYIFNRLKLPPTTSFKELFYLNMHVSNALALLQQAVKIEGQTPGSHAIEIATRVFDRIEKEVIFLKSNRHTKLLELLDDGQNSPSGSNLTVRERQLYVCALLDLASILVSAFNTTASIVHRARELAEALIADSDVKKFRFKAFEILFHTTIGLPRFEYRKQVDRLAVFIANLCEVSGTYGPQTEEDRDYAVRKVHDLHMEMEIAVERFERRMNMYKGAKSSLERRLDEHKARIAIARAEIDSMSGRSATPSDTDQSDQEENLRNSNRPSLSLTVESQDAHDLDDSEPQYQRGQDKAQRLLGLSETDDPRLHMFGVETLDEDDILGSEENTLKAPKRPDLDDGRPLSFSTGVDVLHVTSRMEQLGLTRKTSNDEVYDEIERVENELGTAFHGQLTDSETESEPNMEANVLYLDEKMPVELDTPTSSPEMNQFESYDEKIPVDSDYQESYPGSTRTADSSRRASTHLSIALPIQGRPGQSVSRQESQEFDLPIQSPDESSAPLTSPWGSIFRTKWGQRRKASKKSTTSDEGSECRLKPKRSHSKDMLRREETIRVFLDRKTTGTPTTIEEREADSDYVTVNRSFSPTYNIPSRSTTSNSTRPMDIASPNRSRHDHSYHHSPMDRNYGGHHSESEGFRSVDEFTPSSTSPAKFKGSVNLLQAHGSVSASDDTETPYSRQGNSPSVSTPSSRNKPLPPDAVGSDDEEYYRKPKRKSSLIAAEAPELVSNLQQPAQFRSPRMAQLVEERNAIFMRQQADPPISRIANDLAILHSYKPPVSARKVVYDNILQTNCYKLSPKDNCIANFISTDGRNIVFMTDHSFEVFATPMPREGNSTRRKYSYKLGTAEGLKKKLPKTGEWAYIGGVASTRYIVTITKTRIQVHDLHQDCRVIWTKEETKWYLTCVNIAADKLVVGMSSPLAVESERLGQVRVYKMVSADYSAPTWTFLRDIRLPIKPKKPQDAPHNVSLTHDGRYVTCCTPTHGYFYSWELQDSNPEVLISNGRLSVTQGSQAERLTSAMLFPDARHILCSTVSAGSPEMTWGGCFIEPTRYPDPNTPHHSIRQVGLRVLNTAISKDGSAMAFLTRTGTVYVVPVVQVEKDVNLTSLGMVHPQEKLKRSISPEESGKVMFTTEGDRLIAVDRSGKVIVLTFKIAP